MHFCTNAHFWGNNTECYNFQSTFIHISLEMAEKPPKIQQDGTKPTPMKLFATWEVERTTPVCIARQCTLKLAHLKVVRSVSSDLGSILIAVKMQSAKRTLRSNEIPLQSSGLLDTELELTFSLQYPHFLKGEGNKLQIMLQRRKRYKNRTILGFKTLAVGVINMSQILQRSVDKDLMLYSDPKERQNLAAVLSVESLVSQPVDQEDLHIVKNMDLHDRYDSEEDEEYSTNDECSDSEHIQDSTSKPQSSKHLGPSIRQRNLKQKFMTLLKRFKLSEGLQELDQDQDMDPKFDGEVGELDDLLQELDEYGSDSEPEVDTMSINSTPKPSLRPFFSSSQNLLCDHSVPTIRKEQGQL
ncbi:phosphofurin acidic cluster sorting protein 1-like [Pollicipes pollicipes]|uniref:phosphofurin acidic cluster sorting protein 1-like n=1 Tax=Pollicipes pollicipes TaxID=41117 RepID=UPI001884A907|nr:phosphofurin acidic cluster sorting protein 1-like [Pollicipes pollicipes]